MNTPKSERVAMNVEAIDISSIEVTEESGIPKLVGQEVFETSDKDEDSCKSETDEVQNTEVEMDALVQIDEARVLFENTVISGIADFSGRIDKYGKSFKTYMLEETVEQKLARIKKELQEIELSKETVQHDDELNELVKLHSVLEQDRMVELKIIKNKLVLDDSEMDVVTLPRVTIDCRDSRRLVDLEGRIARIESLLGETNPKKSIVTCINELFHKINLLEQNEPLLEKFDQNMKRISKEYEESIIGRRATKDPSLQKRIADDLKTTDSKVHEIYKSYNLLKRYSGVLPHIITRMKSLNDLHREVQDTSGMLQSFDQCISRLQTQTEKWEQLLDQLNKKLDQQEENFEKNKKSIQTWVESLEMKLNHHSSL
ncbi:Jnm1p Ecym_4767 [Eremothecium cymbalariae DBVPG|uniref:Uncharacterized protein n=1 Tax=Eremothecium cymbalariae (strain CBS 270.75 / DBVPG 7215 / KCTC 17166 / NRRL Y-17582) TaxID=931890 RepID=G8JSQ7_ERECY|nr:hypothetical protein Ecym_4767 [Eremothecium cymbalariae DBVPG\